MSPTLRLAGAPLPLVGRARAYVCGITPYDTTHLGHAATFVWADVASRVLRRVGVEVVSCRNVTDVDDVLDAAAERAGARFDSFAAVGQFRFDRDMAALGVRPPTHEPRAHNHVDGVVALAAALVERGAAYERDGAVLFRAGQVPAPEVPADPDETSSEA
ncbi:MAG TPA: cysteine--tRNA ligase, partial [Actinomycetospora sp.]|nr:cysteine--tRNA ligase [Actinomycetospora sp.]